MLGKFPNEVAEMDYTEFLGCVDYLEFKLKNHEKMDYYFAQLAGMLSGKKNGRINDFLIKFVEPKTKSPLEIAKKLAGYFGLSDKLDAKIKEKENS